MSTVKASNFKDLSGNPLTPARAWVNFDGTGTPTIRAASNVSSITDVGTGIFGINFTSPMPDTNYAVVVTAGMQFQTTMNDSRVTTQGNPVSVSQAYVNTQLSAVSAYDTTAVNVAVFR